MIQGKEVAGTCRMLHNIKPFYVKFYFKLWSNIWQWDGKNTPPPHSEIWSSNCHNWGHLIGIKFRHVDGV